MTSDIETLLDNAATASQVRELLRDADGQETVLREAVRLNVVLPLIASARQAQDNAKDARTLEDAVLDMCARIDVSGESAKLDTWEDAIDYFQTVSMNIGMARVHIERTRGSDYYGECYEKYKREDKEWADRRAAIAAATPGKGGAT